MSDIRVVYDGGDRLRVGVRGHELVFDQPLEAGGGDAGPTPTEAFVASLAGCVAFYAERFLRRHGVAPDGLAVEADLAMAAHPSRVGSVALRVVVPGPLADELREPLLRVMEHCTVHNSLRTAPDVRIALAAPAPSPHT